MSTVLCLTMNGIAIAASDGRITYNHEICDDEFDKTFEITNGDKKFIGAFAGAVTPGGKSIGVHLQEILNHNVEITIEDTAEFLVSELHTRLRNISLQEFRVVDLILVGSQNGIQSNLKMNNIRYAPNAANNDVEIIERYTTGGNIPQGGYCWSIFGDDNAKDAINDSLNQGGLGAPAQDEASLRNFCERLISIGVSRATINPAGHASCGGTPFTKTII